MKAWHRLATGVAIAASGSGCAAAWVGDYDVDVPPQQLAVLGTPPPNDGRARFRQIFCSLYDAEPRNPDDDFTCDDALHRLAGEPDLAPAPLPPHDTRLRFLIVTSALGECVADIATPFDQGVERLEPLGYRIETIVVGGMSSSTYNARMIAEVVGGLELEPSDRLVLLGYSKGVPDILHFLVEHPGPAERVRAVVGVSGAVNGSPLADGFSDVFYRYLAKPAALFCEGRDFGMMRSLRRGYLLPWLAANPLPSHVRTFTLAAFTDAPHIARLLGSSYDNLAPVDARNDGQMTFTDQIVPGSTLLGYANADHYAVAQALEERRGGFFFGHPHRERAFPRAVLFEAIVRFVSESLAAE